jgi:hypothetical protein
MSENEDLKGSFQDIIDEMRKKRSFEYQRLDPDGNWAGGFHLDWHLDTQIWTVVSGSVPGGVPREYSQTGPEAWERFSTIVGTTDMRNWQDLPKDEDDNQLDRVWLFCPTASSQYCGVGIDHRLATICKIVPGLAAIADLIRACDLQVDGNEAKEAEDPTLEYLEQINGLRPSAAGGDKDAQAELGARLVAAPVQYRDFDEGIKWLTEAAKSGHQDAEYNVGTSYLHGYSGKTDPKTAFHWLEKAAAKKHLMAMRNIGIMLMYGNGCTQDQAKGYDYLLRASKLGDYPSLLNIGQLYLVGTYVKKDPQEAAAWFILSHHMGAPEAAEKLLSLREHFEEDELESVVEKAQARIPSLSAELNS